MKKQLLIYLFLICTAGYAQQQQLKKADRLFAEYAYTEAAEAYEDYLKQEKQPGTETVRKIADTYYYIAEFGKAKQWYTKLNDILGAAMDDTYFNRYIQTLRMAEEYKKADDLMKQRLAKTGNKALLANFVNQKKYLDSVNSAKPAYAVTNSTANTKNSDFGTAFYGNRIVYSSTKDTTSWGQKTYKWNEQPFLELFVADRNASDGSFFNEEKFIPKDQNSYHNATLAFSSDLKTVYYSTNTLKKGGFLKNADDGTNNLQIIKGTIEEGRLQNAETLAIGSAEYSVGHPALTADGKWLYFTSDMPGGFGETDIYKVEVGEGGQLGQPANLGATINTPQREMFPFINDSILYFSSDGHYGLGGLDVFASEITNGEAGTPRNIGKPINSSHDDFAFIIDKEKTYGYLSSNRKGGKGDDDIYYFTHKVPECQHLLAGTVTHARYKIPINQAEVKLYDELGDMIASVKTGEDGKYSFEAPCESKFTIEASKAEHNSVTKDAVTTNVSGGETVTDFELINYDDLVRKEDGQVKIDINPIFFDLDKYDITPRAVEELNKVVYVMKNFPTLVIKIESHTDSRASDDYNITLSENRAKATFDYITSHGIEANRIESVKGYGETHLRNRCSNDVPCSEEEHQLNRRSDFVVVRR